jgi:DNA repair exonuclease SbcCD nuclease subunit
MKALYVGDVHAVASELEDCENLLKGIEETAVTEKVDSIRFSGDIYNNHDTVSLRVVHFWDKWFKALSDKFKVDIIAGNHDQSGPGLEEVNALLSHHHRVNAVTRFDCVNSLGTYVAALPYIHEPDLFIQAAKKIKELYPQTHTLFCHQTFDGACYENGFYAKDAVTTDLGFTTIIAGHIHKKQTLGPVTYIGSPRWRTRSDANCEKTVSIYEHTLEGTSLLREISTDQWCRKIVEIEDKSDTNPPVNSLHLTYVNIYGTPERVKEREVFWRNKGCRTRSFMTTEKVTKIKESEGIEKSFSRYVEQCITPNNTPKDVLLSELQNYFGQVL